MRNNLAPILIAVLIAAMFTACGPSPAFSDSVSLEDGIWAVDNPIEFAFDIPDTNQLYNFYITMRNGSNYPYSNIYLFVKTNFPNGRTKVDTLECTLASPTGKWYGSGIGDLSSHTLPYLGRRRFPLPGEYTLSIHHAMRLDELPDIYDVGLRMEYADL